jgi:hypothetical protein
MRNVVRAVGLTVLLIGCGDDHDDGAQQKCETLVTTFCESVTSCAQDADLLADDYRPSELLADCRKTISKGAHCGDAKEVSSKYASCLEAAGEGLGCEDSNQSLLDDRSFAIPALCQGVVGY